MNNVRFLGVVAFAALFTLTGSVAAAKGLVGKWRAHTMKSGGKVEKLPKGMKVLIEFKKDKTYVATAVMPARGKKPPPKSVERGTWAAKGKRLTIKMSRKTETMTYVVKRNTLTLVKDGGQETATLKRVR